MKTMTENEIKKNADHILRPETYGKDSIFLMKINPQITVLQSIQNLLLKRLFPARAKIQKT